MKLILDSNKRWSRACTSLCFFFDFSDCVFFFFLPSRLSIQLCCPTFKELNSLWNCYDKIMFSCWNANSFGHVVSLCPNVLWFCLSFSSSGSHKQSLVSVRDLFFFSSFLHQSYCIEDFCSIASEDCLIFSAEKRKTITLRKDEWTVITRGKFMVIFCTTSTSHPQIRSLCSHSICYRWCWANIQFSMNATCGCRQPLRSQTKTHYHK